MEWALALLILQFWPESAGGWIPVLGFVFAALAFAGSVFVAIKVKPWADQVHRWQTGGTTPVAMLAEVNAVGKKVDDHRMESEKERAEHDARLKALEIAAREHEGEIRRAREAVAECRAWMERVSTEQHDMKLEIIGHISEATGKLTNTVHELDKKVAVLADRTRDR